MHFIIFAAAALSFSACRTGGLRPVLDPASSKTISSNADSAELTSQGAVDEKRAEALARFATGITYELNEKSEQALEQFYRAAKADPANEQLILDLAYRFSEHRQFDKAEELLVKASEQPNASGNIFSALARLYLTTGKTNLALHAAESAVKKAPAAISGYQTLAELLLQKKQSDAVLKLLTSASHQTNSHSIFLIGLAELYGKLAEARPEDAVSLQQKGLEILSQAADQKPKRPNVRQRLADGFARLGGWRKAAELYLDLVNEFNDVPEMRDALREKLAKLYLRSSDKAKAAEQLEAVVRENPTRYPEAWFYLGSLAHESKNYSKAVENFGRALLLSPELEPAYYELAGAQINADQAGEALKTLEQARAKFSNTFTGEFFTGLAFARMKNFGDAVKHFTTAEVIASATDTNRLNHLFYFQLASAHERNHDYEQAENYLEKCLQLSPDFSEAMNYLGFMWADRGIKLEKARSLIEKAVKLEPKNPAYIDSLGWVLFKLKEPQAALTQILKAIDLSEQPDASLYDHLGDIYDGLKQNDKAREAWQKSLSIEPNEDVKKKLPINLSP
ncbi:MAG: tetratricopeptide repeat protein [Verrucomicrobiota bacterium]